MISQHNLKILMHFGSKTLYFAPRVYYGIQYKNVRGYVNFRAQLYCIFHKRYKEFMTAVTISTMWATALHRFNAVELDVINFSSTFILNKLPIHYFCLIMTTSMTKYKWTLTCFSAQDQEIMTSQLWLRGLSNQPE